MNKYCDSLEDAVAVYKKIIEESSHHELDDIELNQKYQNLVFLLSISGMEIPVDYEPTHDEFGGGKMEHDIVSSRPLLECNDRLKSIMVIYAFDKLEPFRVVLMTLAQGHEYNFSKAKFKDEFETPKDHILNIYHILEEIDDPYSMMDFARVSRRIVSAMGYEISSYCERFYPKNPTDFMHIYGEYNNGKYTIDETFMNSLATHYGNGGTQNGK